MIQNRELTMNDYSAMLRRRAKVILIPAVVAPIVGFLVSYAFPPKYTSQALVMVEQQKVPPTMVQPVVSEDPFARINMLWPQTLSQSRLQPVVDRLYPGKSPQDVSDILDDIRRNAQITPVPDISTSTSGSRKPNAQPTPGFTISYTSNSPRLAQQVCNELTTILVDENLKLLQDAAKGTSDVLNSGLESAKRDLDEMEAKKAEFKRKYVGQLPEDADNNLRILTGLNTQLDANTQTLNRAQQDKAYTESMLAQQLTTWKASQETTNPQTLEKQLAELQSQLLQLQAKYTNDHPDVIKAKSDIAEVKKKLAEVNKAPANSTDTATQKALGTEPAEIRQMRLQLHQYEDLINAATRDQKRLQKEIASYQARVSLSPAVEEQYKQLTRDYAVAQKGYDDLLAKKNSADLTVQMNNQSQGERMFPLNPANLPDSPSFPNRLLFLAGGFGAGLAIGLGLALWLEIQDNSIRTEADAEAALELPLLVSVPWVGAVETKQPLRLWGRVKKEQDLKKDTVAI